MRNDIRNPTDIAIITVKSRRKIRTEGAFAKAANVEAMTIGLSTGAAKRNVNARCGGTFFEIKRLAKGIFPHSQTGMMFPKSDIERYWPAFVFGSIFAIRSGVTQHSIMADNTAPMRMKGMPSTTMLKRIIRKSFIKGGSVNIGFSVAILSQ